MSVLSPGLYIWTAGSGLHDGNFINWTHKGKVHTDTIDIANSLPNQYLGSFDLDAYDNVTHYQQAVENWLSETFWEIFWRTPALCFYRTIDQDVYAYIT